MIKRYFNDLNKHLKPNKVLIIYGARRVGKTTLIEQYLKSYKKKYKLVSGDNFEIQETLSSNNFDKILEFCQGIDLLIIDEAQNIKNIGSGLKIIIDNIKGIKVIATGSSSFDLANQVGEPLVGRQNTINLFPVSQLELQSDFSDYELKKNLEQYLRFGSYPEALTFKKNEEKRDYLTNLVNSYLYKDILALNTIKNSVILSNLVKKLSFNIGNELSPNSLSQELGINVKTTVKYLDLLEKSFIIFRIQGFSKNLANEITKKQKYYFYDLGIRNAVINQFNKLSDRNDIGGLWENFVVIERIKRNQYKKSFHLSYFWRTYQQHEVDYIEEKDAKVQAYEIKWSERVKSSKGIKVFTKTYDNSEGTIINKENYLKFICK